MAVPEPPEIVVMTVLVAGLMTDILPDRVDVTHTWEPPEVTATASGGPPTCPPG
jgi:hypothetical protein